MDFYHGSLQCWYSKVLILKNLHKVKIFLKQKLITLVCWKRNDERKRFTHPAPWTNQWKYKNHRENTKARAGSAREPVVGAETQKNMIAFYHKKQEEAKKLMSVDEDEYLNSAWADPKNLKRQLNGTGDVRWRI
ncbi:unnamed protein product [Blepharisma stoltei]|uniref:Uncharacterized protein n=1 Tax=Blepharisma stoltei TaxID=1481888 RepID=A0AAU9JGS2_9CILI|nr:unnamed protein product [Blepharisma stoltei]